MRSASLFAVLALVFVLAVSSFSPVFAAGYIHVEKVTTNGDTETIFLFDSSSLGGFQLVGGESTDPNFAGPFYASDFPLTITEQVPDGWVLTGVDCVDDVSVGSIANFEYVQGGVTISILNPQQNCPDEGQGAICFVLITCTFTNSPVSPSVGGVVIPANTLAILMPWLAVIGVVGCIGTIVVIAKKREK
jgi:hypothetical protein